MLVGVGDGRCAGVACRGTSGTFAANSCSQSRACGRGAARAVFLADLRIPKLVLVKGDDTDGQATAAAAYRHAIGPLVVRHLPGGEAPANEMRRHDRRGGDRVRDRRLRGREARVS